MTRAGCFSVALFALLFLSNCAREISFENFENFESGSFDATLFSRGGGGGEIVSDPEKVVSGGFSAYGKGDSSKSEWCEFLYSDKRKLALKRMATYALTFKYKAVEQPSNEGFYYFLARSNTGGIKNDEGFTQWSDSTGASATKTVFVTLGNFDDYYFIWGVHGQGALSIDDIKILEM